MKFVTKSLLGLMATAGLTSAAFAADLPNTKSAPVLANPAPWFLFSDTSLSYRIETRATDPGGPAKFVKNIGNITHVDAWQYGTNFVSVDVLKSTGADPANPGAAFAPFTAIPYATSGVAYVPAVGATELYGIYRGTLSGNALSRSKMFEVGPVIKDISFGFGGDVETDNTAFAPNKRALVFGPQFSFNVPGFLTFQAEFYKEWNHNAIAQGLPVAFAPGFGTGTGSGSSFNKATGQVSFRPTVAFETAYAQPLTFTGLPLTLTGFANVILPKGKDGFGNNTRTEFLTAHRLVLDVGSYFGRAKTFDVFVGYKFWYNKFGNDAHYGIVGEPYVPGSYENQFFAGIAVHLQ